MNRIVRSALLCTALTGFAHAQVTRQETGGMRVGAYDRVAIDSQDVQAARAFVQTRMLTLSLGEVAVAYEQVVNGSNFKLICTALENGRPDSWKFVVYRSLSGEWQLEQAERL